METGRRSPGTLVIAALLFAIALAASAAASTKSDFLDAAQDVTQATAFKYRAKDDRGGSMDGVKVLADPTGGYLAVYHTSRAGMLNAKLATSTNLLDWTWRRDLAGPRTAMPALAFTPGGGFVLVCEKGDVMGQIGLHFEYYTNRAALFAGTVARSFDAPPQLSTTSTRAEGTPNIEAATFTPDIDHSRIEIGFHYFRKGKPSVDRQARGVLTNFTTWAAAPFPQFDEALTVLGCSGNIGDRDSVSFKDGRYVLIEGQQKAHDWATWNVFLWDATMQKAEPLRIKTHGGSKSFGNPSVTALTSPNGKPALLFAYFLFSEGAAKGESGPLIFYRELR